MTDLDPRTIAFAAAASAALLTLMAAWYWAARPTHPGFGLWVTSLVLITTALLFIIQRERFPPYVGEVLTNLCSLLALACVTLGLRRFNGQDLRDPVLGVLLIVGTIGILQGHLFELPLVRSARGAAAMGVVGLWAAWTAVQAVSPRLRAPALMVAGVLLLLGIWRLWRAWFFLSVPADHDILEHELASVVNFTFNVLFVPMWSFAFFLLHAARTEAELEDAREAARALAERDALTGVGNRRVLFERMTEEVARARRYGHALALLLVDVDHFKRINDAHGHPAGDAVLRRVAEVLGAEVRGVDRVARLGGEEFAVLLPETDGAAARAMAERLRVALAAARIRIASGEVAITVSIGVASLGAGQDVDALYRAADQAMYRAKAAGRDRVEA